MKYIIISPVKNESGFIEETIQSIIAQSILPKKWIIVDDGSNDNTVEIIEKYITDIEWIELIRIDNKNEKKLYGSKVINAFNKGFASIKEDIDYDFIVKIDADVTLPNNYFEEISNAFNEDKKLGICGGYIVEKEGDFEVKQKGITYIQGAIKSVRKECFDEIGGFKPINGWDGLDQFTAIYKGWQIRNIPLKVFHRRIEATEYNSLNFFFNNGVTTYQMGNNIFLTLIRAIAKIRMKPYIIGSIYYFYGYIYAVITRPKKHVDKALGKFIRSYTYKRIFHY